VLPPRNTALPLHLDGPSLPRTLTFCLGGGFSFRMFIGLRAFVCDFFVVVKEDREGGARSVEGILSLPFAVPFLSS